MTFQQQEPYSNTGFCRSVPAPQQVGVRLKLDASAPWKPLPKPAPEPPLKQG
jgi:hypothetical protein